jgi:poly(3-hydroxybutyrate) depolymerase
MKRRGDRARHLSNLFKIKLRHSKKQLSKNKKTKKSTWLNKPTWLYVVGWAILLALIVFAVYSLVYKANKEDLNVSGIIIKEKVKIGDREFIFSKYEGVKNAPVIILLHGGAQDDNVWFNENGQALIVESAINKGYAVIAPDSVRPLCENVKQWDYRENSSDLAFFDEILNYIWSKDDLDSDRIYVAGISIGGFMASRLAEHYGDSINAIAITSGGNADNLVVYPPSLCYVEYNYNLTNIKPDHPRTLLIHGDNDTIIPIEAALNYYGALKEAGRGAKIIVKEQGEHHWYPEYNDAILDWFN